MQSDDCQSIPFLNWLFKYLHFQVALQQREEMEQQKRLQEELREQLEMQKKQLEQQRMMQAELREQLHRQQEVRMRS